jgi:hypothetical protein
MQSINIPDSVIYVGESAFYGCSFMKSINIPKGQKISLLVCQMITN